LLGYYQYRYKTQPLTQPPEAEVEEVEEVEAVAEEEVEEVVVEVVEVHRLQFYP
jgi:hypothetical protein